MCIGKYEDSHLSSDMVFKSAYNGTGSNALQFVTLQRLTSTNITRLEMEVYCCRALLHTQNNVVSADKQQGWYAY